MSEVSAPKKKDVWVHPGQTFMIVDTNIGLGGRYDVKADMTFNFTAAAAEYREQALTPLHAQDGSKFVDWLVAKEMVSRQQHPPFFAALDTGYEANFGK